MEKVAVIGGGAAGMIAAIHCAENGAAVTIYEKNDKLGKKILSTGNGKCNLSNENMSIDNYYAGDISFVEKHLKTFGTEETIQFFRNIGLFIKSQNGYLYPYSEQAASVLDALRFRAEELGISVKTGCTVTQIIPNKKGFCIESNQGKDYVEYCVLCCGSKAAPKLSSDGLGYPLAKQLGHSIAPVVPALVQLKCSDPFFKSIAGVRAKAELYFEKNGVTVTEKGEVQFTEYGISGIPVFQISREINYLLKTQKTVPVTIDFMPQYTEEQLLEEAQRRLHCMKNCTMEPFFTGLLNKKIMNLFMQLSGLKPQEPLSNIVKTNQITKIEQCFRMCKCFEVHVNGSNSYENAQVCAGGVKIEEIKDSFESKIMDRLYFAGEIMDVDGKCGGYNLQWAWCSGYLAAEDISKRIK